MAEHLTAQDDTNAAWLRDLAVSYHKLYLACQAAGDLEDARRQAHQCLDALSRMKKNGLFLDIVATGVLEELEGSSGESRPR